MIPDNYRVPVFILVIVIMIAVVVVIFTSQGIGSSGGLARSSLDIQKTAFIEVDFDLAELVTNVQEVDFSYTDVRETRNPMTPLAVTGTEFGGGEIPDAGDEFLDSGEVSPIYEANRKELKGILWNPTNPMAVVTDRTGEDVVVTVGYLFKEGIRVTKISVDSITLAVSLEGEVLEIVRQLLREEEQ